MSSHDTFFPKLKPTPIPGQAKSPDDPFGAATTDNGGNFADFSAFEVNIVIICSRFVANFMN